MRFARENNVHVSIEENPQLRSAYLKQLGIDLTRVDIGEYKIAKLGNAVDQLDDSLGDLVECLEWLADQEGVIIS